MTIQTIQPTSESFLLYSEHMDWGKRTPSNTQSINIYDLRSDELPVSGVDEEFDIEEYALEQDEDSLAAVSQAGSWVAETLYPGLNTLSTLRLRAGLSQKQLAHMCGVEQPHISRYESGHHQPGIYQGKEIANALGVTLDELYEALKATALSVRT